MREGKVKTTPRNRAPELPSRGARLWGSAIAKPRRHKRSEEHTSELQSPDHLVSPDIYTLSLHDALPIFASVLKIASQRFKNRIDPTLVLQEKHRKPNDARRKGQNDAA